MGNGLLLAVRPSKPQKIDLQAEYPCPCGRKGRMVPITLTEAFGCNRCQHIFVVEENGYVLEQLSTTYPYKKTWHWTGLQWNRARTSCKEHYFPFILSVVLGPPIVWLVLALHAVPIPDLIFWTVVASLLMLLPAFIVWLVYRH